MCHISLGCSHHLAQLQVRLSFFISKRQINLKEYLMNAFPLGIERDIEIQRWDILSPLLGRAAALGGQMGQEVFSSSVRNTVYQHPEVLLERQGWINIIYLLFLWRRVSEPGYWYILRLYPVQSFLISSCSTWTKVLIHSILTTWRKVSLCKWKQGEVVSKKISNSCRSCCGPSTLDVEHYLFQGRVPFQMRYFFFLETWVFGFRTGERYFETKQTVFLHDECTPLWPVEGTSKLDKHLWKGKLFNILQR